MTSGTVESVIGSDIFHPAVECIEAHHNAHCSIAKTRFNQLKNNYPEAISFGFSKPSLRSDLKANEHFDICHYSWT